MSEEEIIEENIKRYIKEHSRTIKAYTQEYVDKLQSQLQQKENIIKEAREKLIKSKEYQAVKSLGLDSKMSILIELEELLDKENKEAN